jgi:hypothetical protein
MKEVIAIIAALLAIAGNVPYLRDIVKHRVQPHAYTWFVWSIVSCIVFFGQVAKGAGIGALPTAASEIFTVIIFLFFTSVWFQESDHSGQNISRYCASRTYSMDSHDRSNTVGSDCGCD